MARRTPGQAEVDMVLEKERQLARIHRGEVQRHDELHDDIRKISDGLHLHHVKYDHSLEQLSEKLGEVRGELEQSIYRHRTDRHTAETKLERLADKYAAEAFSCVAEEKKLQEESTKYTKDVQAEICHLYNDIQQARVFRVEKGKKLAEGVAAKLEEVQDAVAAEQRIREDSTNTLLELMGQMGEKLQRELEECRDGRERMTERIMAMVAQSGIAVNGPQARRRSSLALSSGRGGGGLAALAAAAGGQGGSGGAQRSPQSTTPPLR